jgi:hypothetical protein
MLLQAEGRVVAFPKEVQYIDDEKLIVIEVSLCQHGAIEWDFCKFPFVTVVLPSDASAPVK